jgi:hypothetical protein
MDADSLALCAPQRADAPHGSLRERLHPAVSQWETREYDEVSENLMPGLKTLYGEIVRQKWVTASRDEITDEATYHASPM